MWQNALSFHSILFHYIKYSTKTLFWSEMYEIVGQHRSAATATQSACMGSGRKSWQRGEKMKCRRWDLNPRKLIQEPKSCPLDHSGTSTDKHTKESMY